MVWVLSIGGLAIVLMICSVLFKPSVVIEKRDINIYWLAPLAGALILILAGFLSWAEVGEGLVADTSINPIKILILFLSMTFLSVFLDEIGFFAYLASIALQKAGNSQKRLFVYLYLTVSVLTVFTSNDIIVLTFTPFVCHFAKGAKINPVPYLIAEFVAANTWSMALIIGNPTNIYLATSFGVGFLQYISVMILPAFFAGTVAFCVLYLLFRKELTAPIQAQPIAVEIGDKPLLVIALIHLVLCTVLLAVASYIGLEMWLIAACFAGSLFVCAGLYLLFRRRNTKLLVKSLFRAPWELVPFVLSMFVIVLALEKQNIPKILADFLAGNSIFAYGGFSLATANLVNNIPMSVLMSAVVQAADPVIAYRALYACIIGSNIGAFLTPIGALAGIMWLGILKKHEVKISFGTFVKYGFAVAIPTALAAFGGLELAFLYS